MGLSQKQKDQWIQKMKHHWNLPWIEQVDEGGNIFLDRYMRPKCEFIKSWASKEEWEKEQSFTKDNK